MSLQIIMGGMLSVNFSSIFTICDVEFGEMVKMDGGVDHPLIVPFPPSFSLMECLCILFKVCATQPPQFS